MNISEVKRMQDEKDHLMRNEGKHPANKNAKDREEDEKMRDFGYALEHSELYKTGKADYA